MANDLHQPHDAFFKRSLTNQAVAKDLLQAHLAPALCRRIDWDTLQLTNKSFVQKALQQFHSDVVYRCQVDNKEAYVYTLIEHQSTPEPLLPFRFLQYNVLLMEAHLAQGHKRLPLIANLCLYAGKQSPYPYSLALHDCFEAPELAKRLLRRPLTLIDLGQWEAADLVKHGTADLVQLLLKQGIERSFLTWIKEHPALIEKLLCRYYDISGLHYILGVESKHDAEAIVQAIVEVAPDKKETIMTAATQLRQEGLQQGIRRGRQEGMQEGEKKGRQEGRQEGTLAVAKRMLAKGIDLALICDVTGLRAAQVEKLATT